ncbi:RIP metalloprotease RseP [Candidatus Azambacteria bacterium RIFCSPHIGHO2_02_FULL_45_18]|uniref:Zinc metalloprotease n=1 Tax=Candidatus Azambacteria bacterium RIFCSPLOWO2_02_FULL_44_14 TaxID=1797306 RepID=A0A1F5CBX2_9BACT|nr:MAG: RIP metalloprotease RseP [Candidatus Azambacteria bacterium RIFCSPHIGHO2_02_FULL_45_18]OGD40318.1 MAG: RIP metalloprotease RseP [Candidatus Azambacteria bacterium RIFCSPLOWO2_02_FULL_44_14]
MTIIIFIIVLAILILVHEFGHFIIAKRAGLVVEEFGFGFPPRIFSFKKGDTIYSINLLPLGGFVKILGEDGKEGQSSKSFASKKPGVKSLITVAGPLMNFLLATALLTIGYNIGLPTAIDETNAAQARDIGIQIIAISPSSPAEKAGLILGDQIVKFDAMELKEISSLQEYIKKEADKIIRLTVNRSGELKELDVLARKEPPKGEGAMGVVLAKVGTVSYPWYESIWRGIKSAFVVTWEIIRGLAGLLKNLLFAGKIPKEISGPVGIAVLTRQATDLGTIYLLQLIAIISLNLAVLNLMPFPALDGGRIVFFGIEKLKGSRVSPKIENAVNAAGFVLLIALVLLITYRDILRLR